MTPPPPVKAGHDHFPHDADLGVRGVGPCLAAAFEQAGMALSSAMTPLEDVAPLIEVGIQCAAPDNRILLIDWLNALILQMTIRRMLFSRFRVKITDHRLDGAAWGESLDPARHHPALEPKGATFAASRVERQPDGTWIAQCVVDV